jgi:hypothetical protein
MFDCQGELAKGVKFLMKIQFGSENRTFALEDNSKGQPDASRLERARIFTREIIENTNSKKKELALA